MASVNLTTTPQEIDVLPDDKNVQNSILVTLCFPEDHASTQEENTAEHSTRSSSEQPSGLSPQRVPSLPRAWERRPTVPFIGRNEAQKIWKRVPLGVVGANDGQKWRKETSRLNTRPVKRLRVTHLGLEDKENVDYVGSKWEEDGHGTPSPKRKALECGEVVELEIQKEDQNMPISGEPNETNDEDQGDKLTDTEHDSTSLLLNVGDPDALDGEGAVAKGDGPSLVLNTVLPSIEVEILGPSLTAVDQCLAARASPTTMASPTKPASSGTNESANLYSSADTAYLWEFISRMKAEKEAKEQAEREDSSRLTAGKEAHDEDAEPFTNLPELGTSAVTPEPDDVSANLLPEDDAETKSSPRRSSRLTTRLPRPHKAAERLPSNISLKRLAGSEFIANNKETQSIAVATRQNTKTNKFGAIAVKTRLIQLDAEARARAISRATTEPTASGEESVDQKRKKSKKKDVSWAETLATFQDGSDPLKDDSSDGGSASDETNQDLGKSPETNSENTSNTHKPDGYLATEPLQSLIQMIEHKNTTRSGTKKVRKLRRLNIGSVNGTPAPKRFTNTHLPLPVGSKTSSSASSSSESERVKLNSNEVATSENTKTESFLFLSEGRAQMRTRSKDSKNL